MILFSKVKCPWYWRLLNVLSHLLYRRQSPHGSVGPRWWSCRKFAKLPGTWNPENGVRDIYFFNAKNFSVIFPALSVLKSLSFMFFASSTFMFYFLSGYLIKSVWFCWLELKMIGAAGCWSRQGHMKLRQRVRQGMVTKRSLNATKRP